jgi:YD repeat-containing protein
VTTIYDGHGRLTSYSRTGDATQSNVYNGLDQRVSVTSGSTIRRFVYDPDGRVIGEYGTSATNVIAERIWLTPEINDGDAFGGDDGTGLANKRSDVSAPLLDNIFAHPQIA